MTVPLEEAILAALLLVLSGSLLWLAAAASRRYRSRSFLLLALAFGLFLAEGIALSLFAVGSGTLSDFPISILVGVQVIVLVLVYAATFPPP